MTPEEIDTLAKTIADFEATNAAMLAKADRIARKLSITSIDAWPFVVVKMNDGNAIGALHVIKTEGGNTHFNFTGQTPDDCQQYSRERAQEVCSLYPDLDLKPMGKVEFWRQQEQTLRAAATAFDTHIAAAKQRLADAQQEQQA